MSEQNIEEVKTEEQTVSSSTGDAVALNGFFAFKKGMSTIYNENGEAIPVTVLKYEPWYVSQVKTVEKDGYEAVQIACGAKKAKNTIKAQAGQLKDTPFEHGAQWVKEIRQSLPDGVKVGQQVSIESLVKGDKLSIVAKSKGHGFSGVIKRWSFGGGPGAHGSTFHRQPGSIGNRTYPGRVMPGKKMPGHYGNEQVTVRNVQVIDVIPEESVVLVKGPVPGSMNTLVRLMKV